MSKSRSLKVIARVDDLAREIRHDYIIVKKLTEKARNSCNEAIAEAILLGTKLREAKELVGHGKWLEWLAKTCPEICERTAQRYIRLSNASHVSDLESAGSLRQAYLAAGVIVGADEKKTAPAAQQSTTPEQSEFPPDQYTHVTAEPQPVIEATVVEAPPLEQAQQPEQQQQQAEQSTATEETPSTLIKQRVKEFMAYLQSLDKAWKKKAAVHLKPIVIHYHRYHKS